MLLALAFAGVADAQTDLPRVRNAQLGFSGQVRNRHWTPLVVDVENPGPARVGLLVEEFGEALVQLGRIVGFHEEQGVKSGQGFGGFTQLFGSRGADALGLREQWIDGQELTDGFAGGGPVGGGGL